MKTYTTNSMLNAERKQTENELYLLQAITESISDVDNFLSALKVTLKQVCKIIGWDYGESWIPNSDDTMLEYGPVWYGGNSNDFKIFYEASEKLTFSRNKGLPGRVWSKKKYEWMKDVSKASVKIFLRSKIVLKAGLKTGFGVPIVANNKVLAVLVFFKFESLKQNKREVVTVSAIASQLGTVFRHKQAEEMLIKSEQKYRNLFEKSGDAILIIENGYFVDCNQAMVNMLCYKNKEELLKTHPSKLSPEKQPDGRASFEKANEMMKTALQKGTHRFEWDHKKADGEIFPVEVLLTAISVEGGNEILHTVWRDITERKEAEEKLIKEKTYQKVLLESAPEANAVLDNKAKITDINREFTRLFGYKFEEIKGLPINDVVMPEDLMDEGESYTKRAQDGERIYAESKRKRKDGTLVEISLLGAPIFDTDGKQIGTYAIYRDLTESHKFQKLLSEREKRLELILNTAANAIITINDKGIIETFNKSAVKTFGYTEGEIIGKNVKILMEEPDKSKHDTYINKYMRTGESKIGSSSREVVGKRKNGETFPAELFMHRVNLDGETVFVGLLKDITKRKKFQAERERLTQNLEQARRMESLGLLAGGVAHDLNNIIGPIMAYPDLILAGLPENTPLKEDLDAISSAAQRASNVISDLLALARRGDYSMKPLYLSELIDSFIDSLEFKEIQKRFKNVAIKVNMPETIEPIMGSGTHLYKLILNLVNNAFESMEAQGELIISITNKYLGSGVIADEKFKEGNFVVLTIRDEGNGIKQEDLVRIFEPFFTKKVKSDRTGSGLGLSVVYNVIKDHNAFIDVESELGVGTKFLVYFPVTVETVIRETDLIDEYKGSGSILVVDDKKSQRQMAEKILSSLGYTVATADNGLDAVKYIKRNKVDLVMLDMILEDGIDGLDTFKEIIKINSRQKVIIVSGFSETERVQEAITLGVERYIKKPYTLKVIGKTLAEVLNN
ncbi:MAG: PAS domain S-box protein [Candidatus Marinimicrobia bacterium]|nr:PAS domain S-box protein [Candidatus Neomarinimicrobiota bacterium]